MRSFVLFFFLPLFSFSQQRDYSTCDNALDVNPSGSYHFSFLGKKGLVAPEGVFQHINNPSKNQIWVHYTCSVKGKLHLTFKQNQAPINILVFKERELDFCLSLKEQNQVVLLEKTLDSLSALETQLSVEANDQYYLLFVAKEKTKQLVDI